MTFDPMSVEVTCVTLPKDHYVQVPWQYINVCGYSDQFCNLPHTYTYYIHVHTTYYVQNEWSHSLLLNSVQARQTGLSHEPARISMWTHFFSPMCWAQFLAFFLVARVKKWKKKLPQAQKITKTKTKTKTKKWAKNTIKKKSHVLHCSFSKKAEKKKYST